MWGFFKCNYSYTKILIVLLFSLSHLFFFSRQGDSRMRACPGSSMGRRRNSWEAVRGLSSSWWLRPRPFPPPREPPHSLPPPQQRNTKGQVSMWSLCGEPWTQAQRLWHWDSGWFWSGKPGASLVRFTEMGKWSGLPAHFIPVCSSPRS